MYIIFTHNMNWISSEFFVNIVFFFFTLLFHCFSLLCNLFMHVFLFILACTLTVNVLHSIFCIWERFGKLPELCYQSLRLFIQWNMLKSKINSFLHIRVSIRYVYPPSTRIAICKLLLHYFLVKIWLGEVR